MTADSRIFIDSNVWLYALSNDDDEKGENARSLVAASGNEICFSIQVLNEVCFNLRRKAKADEKEISFLIRSFFLNYRFVDTGETILLSASSLRERHAFSFWDSLIVESALISGSDLLYSEDMQDGFVVDGRLKIVNPFRN